MTKPRLVFVMAVLAMFAPGARAQGGFEAVTGKAFDTAMPRDFYLEGNAIPTEKRNAALVKTPAGAQLLFALIDTTGYSSAIKKKYIGMLIAAGSVSVCGNSVGVGSYGFGLDKPAASSDADARFFLYNQAGEKVAECAAKKDPAVKQPRPLQVVTGRDNSAGLMLGRYRVDLR